MGSLPVDHLQTDQEVSGMRQAQGEAPDRTWRGFHLQRLGLLPDRLPQRLVQDGRRRPVPPPVERADNWFPFCCERCRQVDLLRWNKGAYAIVEPLTPEPPEDEEM